MKFRVVEVGGGLQRAENYCPANLQCAQIALGKCSCGKVEGRDRKPLARQAAQVIGKQSNFLQLCRSRSDRFTDIRKREKLGLRRRTVRTARCPVRTSQRDVPTSKIQLHLIFLGQCPGFGAAHAEITGKLGGETMECKHSSWPYQSHVANQIVIIRVIRKRKCGIDSVAIDRIWIDRPAADHCHASVRDFFQHLRTICARWAEDRKSTRLNSSHRTISYAVFCLKKKTIFNVDM